MTSERQNSYFFVSHCNLECWSSGIILASGARSRLWLPDRHSPDQISRFKDTFHIFKKWYLFSTDFRKNLVYRSKEKPYFWYVPEKTPLQECFDTVKFFKVHCSRQPIWVSRRSWKQTWKLTSVVLNNELLNNFTSPEYWQIKNHACFLNWKSFKWKQNVKQTYRNKRGRTLSSVAHFIVVQFVEDVFIFFIVIRMLDCGRE